MQLPHTSAADRHAKEALTPNINTAHCSIIPAHNAHNFMRKNNRRMPHTPHHQTDPHDTHSLVRKSTTSKHIQIWSDQVLYPGNHTLFGRKSKYHTKMLHIWSYQVLNLWDPHRTSLLSNMLKYRTASRVLAPCKHEIHHSIRTGHTRSLYLRTHCLIRSKSTLQAESLQFASTEPINRKPLQKMVL